MTRGQRRAHVAVWVVLAPAVVGVLVAAVVVRIGEIRLLNGGSAAAGREVGVKGGTR